MTNKSIVTSEYKKKIKILKKHNTSYFSDDNPKITDAEYDKLKLEISYLEAKHPYLKDFQKSNVVGHHLQINLRRYT